MSCLREQVGHFFAHYKIIIYLCTRLQKSNQFIIEI